jgi:hypothetical protein
MEISERELQLRKLTAKILSAGVKVAMHERRGPANFVKLPINFNDLLERSYIDSGKLAGMRVEFDDQLTSSFVIGRDVDNYQIEESL